MMHPANYHTVKVVESRNGYVPKIIAPPPLARSPMLIDPSLMQGPTRSASGDLTY